MTALIAPQSQARAQAMVAALATHCGQNGIGSMSPSIYDTAWVSLVKKPSHDGDWLFPDSFSFILAKQLPSGGWESYASPADGILNTAAALLALKGHMKTACSGGELELQKDWSDRCEKAEAALKQMLAAWDVDSCDQVGFELLIIQHISLLESEGIHLDFPQLNHLRAMRDAKLAKLSPETLYKGPSTLYHSLEALIGYIDFDRVHCWREKNGSMMGSPSSTAAYLMHASTWDNEAETYLRQAIQWGSGHGDGSVPSAWPINVFEVTWVVTTLLEAGVVIEHEDAQAIGTFLRTSLSAHNGVLGFSPGFLPDADDTAKAIMTISYLGQGDLLEHGVDNLIRVFEAETHFRTYPGERNASLSANCNVLICLMTLPTENKVAYAPQIAKAVEFLTAQATNDQVRDKWNLNDLYWMMLLAHAYWLLYHDDDRLQAVLNLAPGLQERIPMLTLHMLIRILHSQHATGGWDNICEVTSYAMLALSWLSRLPWIQQLGDINAIVTAMLQGKRFLYTKQSEWVEGRYLWIEKVSYASNLLSETYCLAAVMTPLPPVKAHTGQFGTSLTSRIPERFLTGMKKAGAILSLTPLFVKMDPLHAFYMRVAEVQACYAFLSLQGRTEDSLFPRSAKGKDKYLFMIPLSFTACAAAQGSIASLSVLYEMMRLAILNFHADEYMEGVIERGFDSSGLDGVRAVIHDLFTDMSFSEGGYAQGGQLDHRLADDDGKSAEVNAVPTKDVALALHGVKNVLSKFVASVLHHPAVLASSKETRRRLAKEIQMFLLAHLTQADDNNRFACQVRSTSMVGHGSHRILQYHNPGRSFYAWVQGSSADSTSCPFSFVFYNCLLGNAHSDIGPKTGRPSNLFGGNAFEVSSHIAYLAEDMCRHLASLCRMYNDAGSMERDAQEGNLNSVNFPEYCQPSLFERSADSNEASKEMAEMLLAAKKKLLHVADFERRGMENTLEEIRTEVSKMNKKGRLVDDLRLFINVTDLYGQVYILKDIGTRTK